MDNDKCMLIDMNDTVKTVLTLQEIYGLIDKYKFKPDSYIDINDSSGFPGSEKHFDIHIEPSIVEFGSNNTQHVKLINMITDDKNDMQLDLDNLVRDLVYLNKKCITFSFFMDDELEKMFTFRR